jgi:tripartite-type tricarboxylate transporter receptor subunit TctC
MQLPFGAIRARLIALVLAGLVGGLLAQHAAVAQDAFPSRPITIVVGFPPGGGTDVITRIFARRMEAILGQPIVIDNRGGAGTTIAGAFVARAPADGYTLMAGSPSSNAIAPHLYANLPYDSTKAFAPVSLLVKAPVVLLVNPKLNVSTVKELIDLYKREPGKHNFATGSSGTHGHLICEWLMATAGVNIVHIPFRGAAPALQAVLAGEPTMIVDNIQVALPHVAAGKLKALAVFSAERAATLPNVPTMVEAGYKDFVTDSWTAIYAPAGTPPEVIAKLSAAAAAAARDPQVIETLNGLNATPVGSPPAVLNDLTKLEYERWGALIRQRNITVN